MSGTTRRSVLDSARQFRDPPQAPAAPKPYILPRVINVAWASIVDGDIMPGELVMNRADNSLIWRRDNTNIYRFDNVATRAL